MERTKRRMTWRLGIPLVIVCIIVGLLVGWAVDKATAMPAPACDSGCTAKVTTKKMGVRKFKNDRLGHVKKAGYTKHAKRVILDELMAVQRRQQAKGKLQFARPLTRAGMWKNFTSHDNCFYEVNKKGSGTWSTWTCSGKPARSTYADFNRKEVRGYICSGLAGIGIGGAISAGATGPWTWVAIGSGWAACMWQQSLEDAAGD